MRFLLAILMTIPALSYLNADEGTNMFTVAFIVRGDDRPTMSPATLIREKDKYYFCIHPGAQMHGSEMVLCLARNCEADVTFDRLDNHVDWEGPKAWSPYLIIYPTTNTFESARKDGKIPDELIFDLPEKDSKETFDSVSIFRVGAHDKGGVALGIVDKLDYVDATLNPDHASVGFSGFHYLKLAPAAGGDCIGSPVFRQRGNKRELLGVFTFATDKTLKKMTSSYVRTLDLKKIISEDIK